ncbi:polymeric immunoglobulin receptor-like protein [Labeo rohita]|nr:polymeric immunoglobulin receptor-like protein [Labeo rohita]
MKSLCVLIRSFLGILHRLSLSVRHFHLELQPPHRKRQTAECAVPCFLFFRTLQKKKMQMNTEKLHVFGINTWDDPMRGSDVIKTDTSTVHQKKKRLTETCVFFCSALDFSSQQDAHYQRPNRDRKRSTRVILCFCEDPNTKPEDFRWTRVESSCTEVSNETPRYKDRVHTFHKTTPSNLSVLISNLTEEDQGTYRCTINNKTTTYTELIVKGCVLTEHNNTKISYLGESVILPCSCEDPKTKPERFEWKRAAVNEMIVSDTYKINDQFQMIRDSPHHLSLRISNLTKTDGGLYVCSVNGKQSTHVNLTVTDFGDVSKPIYLIYLICLMMLLVFATAGCIYWKCTRGCEVQSSNIFCAAGESVLLPCRDIKSQHTDVQWWISDPQTHTPQYSVFPVDAIKGQRYKDRVQIHNLSLSITRLTLDDAETYCCKSKESDRKSCIDLSIEDPNTKPEDFRWTHVESSGTEVSNETPRYKDRVHTFHKTTPSNLSVLISNLTEEDQGTYRCTVNNKKSTDTKLIVKGCVLTEHNNTKISYLGESVVLPCSCEDPKTKPERFEWKRAAVNETLVSDTYKINDRFQMIRDPPHHLSLRISNLMETDGGLYVCSVNGKQSTHVNLTVTDFGDVSKPIYLICLVMLLVFATAGCVYWKCTRGCDVKLPYITCAPGESVLLSCRDIKSPHTDVQWWISDPQTHTPQYSVFPVDAIKGQRYKDRVQIHNLSLSITRLTLDDAETYCCKSKESDRMSCIDLNIEGCTLSETKQEPKTKYTGDSVLLSCSCEDPNTKPEDFRWTHVESSGTEVSNETPRYKDRVHTFHKTTPSNLSVLISSLTEEDQGTYRYTVIIVSVFVSYLESLCRSAGCVLTEHDNTKISYLGESVILPCSCEDPKTKPERFEWKRAAVNETLVSDTYKINGRFQMIRDSPHHLSLRISNLTETDGGLYVCSVNGKQSTHVNL